MTSWIVEVKAARHLAPVIVGNIMCDPNDSRAQVKEKIHAFVRKHFEETAKIVHIAKGSVVIQRTSEWENYETT